MVCSIAPLDLYWAIGFVLGHWICIGPLDLYWAIGFVLGHWRLFFSIRFEFQVITSGKVVKHLAIIRDLGPVVQSLDNFTQLINRYLVDTTQSKPRIKSFYQPDSDLYTG